MLAAVVPEDKPPWSNANASQGSLFWLVGASIILHVLVLLVFSQGVVLKGDLVEAPPETIKARLVFPKPLVTPEPEPTELEPIEEPATEAQIQPDKLEEVKAVEQQPLIKEQSEVVSTNQQSETSPPQTPQVEQDRTRRLPPISARELTQRHLRQLSDSSMQSLSEQATRDYRQQRTSPVFSKPNVDPFQTADEKYMEKVAIRANCSGGTRGTVVGILSIFGGAIKCTKPPTLAPFIENRINKGVSDEQPENQ